MSSKNILLKYISCVNVDDPFQLTFADGSTYNNLPGEPLANIHFKTEQALNDTLVRGSLGFGEAYMAGDIDIEGDVQQAVRLGFSLEYDARMQPSFLEKLKTAWAFMRRRNTIEGSRKNISAHYDLGNDFYDMWLCDEMQYTCAYYHSREDTLEQAQIQKMDLVCRKLRLQPGETLVEAGCGWGHFAMYAARNYGVAVRSFNISQEQVAYAREKAKAVGLGVGQVEYIHDDYRVIRDEKQRYDKFASIGMLEHVGRENYATLFDIIHKVTKPHGLALVHTISKIAPTPTDGWLEKYIFPGGYSPALSEIVGPLETVNRPLHVIDVQNLRYHYALTLDEWARRYEDHIDEIRAKYGEPFVRKFRLYLRGAAAAFRWGGTLLFQLLLSNGYDNEAPLTREHLYDRRMSGAAVPVGRTAMEILARGTEAIRS